MRNCGVSMRLPKNYEIEGLGHVEFLYRTCATSMASWYLVSSSFTLKCLSGGEVAR